MSQAREESLVRGLGTIATVALVAGNVIGSGIFVIPGSLATTAGPLSLLAWPIVAFAYFCLTRVYTDLAAVYPVSGGMQVYAQRAFGDAAGLIAAFMYWVSNLTSNAAFMTGFVGYFQVFFPQVDTPFESFLVAQGLLWSLTLVNILGVKLGGVVQTVTVVLKVLPLLLLAVVLFGSADSANLTPFAPKGFGSLFPAISLVAWLFLGAESVTVPAEEIKDAGRTIRRAAYVGFGLATAVYFLVALSVALATPAAAIADNPSPLAFLAERAMGPVGRSLIAGGALISIIGVLNGWLLVTGRLPFAAARMGVAPRWLGDLHARWRTPAKSLIFSSALTSFFGFSYFSRTLLEAYNLVALAATATALVTIGLTCAAHLRLTHRERAVFDDRHRRIGSIYAVIGLLVVVLMIGGSGFTIVGFTALMVLLPLPLLAWSRR